ncbi:hypothetical protein ACP275_11G070000 [Erythranthe tilingii]
MELVIQPLLLFFTCMMTISYAEDFLQNPDFEIPPSNISANSTTSQFIRLTKANSIPGWSFNGTVSYVTSGANLLFPGSGGAHALQLGENGTINQTFRANTDETYDYVVSFNLIPQSEDCANNRTTVNVTLREKPFRYRSMAFSLGRNLTTNLWESHAFFLGRLRVDGSVDIRIESVKVTNTKDGNNVTCWPMVDAFNVKMNPLPRWYSGNALANGDFEVGPGFFKNSSEGILLDEEEDRFESPLQEWAISGIVKYIDSKHYKVPQGEAAIELLSGDSSSDPGVRIDLNLNTNYTYTLNFTMGDANNSCVGDFTVYVQVGNNFHNFTMRSNGTGSASERSITFKSEFPSLIKTPIILYSVSETRTSYGVLCGPVIDNMILEGSDERKIGYSYGWRIKIHDGVSIFSMFTALVMLMV